MQHIDQQASGACTRISNFYLSGVSAGSGDEMEGSLSKRKFPIFEPELPGFISFSLAPFDQFSYHSDMIPYKIDNIPDTEVKPSSIHGRGLYATKDFSEGKVLAYLDGQYVPWDVYNDRGQLEDEWNAVAGGVMLRTFRTKYYFINHSRTPNLQVLRDPLRIVTRQAITAGKELSLDYREEPLPDDYLEGHGATYL